MNSYTRHPKQRLTKLHWMVLPVSQTERSPLDRLVLFMVCLAILGTVIAFAVYFLVVQPGQVLTPPSNGCVYHHTIFGDWLDCS